MIIAKYIHGSEDSTDIDVHYVFDVLPSFQECKTFCDSDKSENRNIITITDGIVSGCYKGTVDEINNALLVTYSLHKQESPLLVTRTVERDKIMKYIRSVRIILSHLSRSQYRPIIKPALKGTWEQRLDVLSQIKLSNIDYTLLNKHLNKSDILKVIAFQLAQCIGLIMEPTNEIYTKKDAADALPWLEPFLYRQSNVDNDIRFLQQDLDFFINYLRTININEINKYNLTTEKRNG